MTKVFKPQIRAAKKVVNTFSHWDICGTIPDEPAVYVVHHQNLKGPINAIAHLPFDGRLWVFHPFYEREACFNQYYGYTFTTRFGWPKPVAWILAKSLSFVIPGLMHNIGAIPVYRNSRKIVETIRLSNKALLDGEDVLLCPDMDYSSDSEKTYEIYKGFLKLEKNYFKETGTHLAFVTVHCDKNTKTIFLGEPVKFGDNSSFKEQENIIAKKLVDQLNRDVS